MKVLIYPCSVLALLCSMTANAELLGVGTANELRATVENEAGTESDVGDTGNDFNLDDYAGLGFTYAGKTIGDLDRVVQQIDSGNAQKVTANNKITFTFLDQKGLTGLYNNPNYGFTAGEGLAQFSAIQKAEARDSIALWNDLIAPTFVEQKGNGADIQFANSTDPAQAYAYYPEYSFTNAKGWKFFGDVFVADPAVNWTNAWLDFNGYGATTLIHEIGHSMGLSHPGAYNGAGATTYADQAEYAQDSEQYSIMSYWSPGQTGARIVNWKLLFFGNAQTPMLHDIHVAQTKYGADMNTRSGNTVYGFNSTANRDVFDFGENSFPNVAIWDAGGDDTLDFSGFGGGTVIDLRDGQFSSGAAAVPSADVLNQASVELFYATGFFPGYLTQATVDRVGASYRNANAASIADDWGWGGVTATAYNNISIAYGAVIEHAVGSDFRDIIISNEVDNTLTGNAGSDVFILLSDANHVFGTFTNGGTDTITDFEEGVDVVDLFWLGINGDTDFTVNGNYLGIDIDGDGTIDQGIIFENLDSVPFADIFA